MFFKTINVSLFLLILFLTSFNLSYSAGQSFDIAITSDNIGVAVEKYKKGEWLAAQTLLKGALDENPDREDLVILMSSVIGNRAFDEYAKKNMEEAKDLFFEALSWRENEEFYLSLAVIFIKEKDLERTEKYFEKVTKGKSERFELYKDIYKGLGNEYYRRGDTEKALKNLDLAIWFDSTDKDLMEDRQKVFTSNKEEKNYTEEVGSHFNVKYEEGKNSLAGSIVSDILEDAYYTIGSEIGFYPENSVSAVVYSKKKFSSVTDTPDWAGGLYDGRIHIPVGGVKEKTKKLESIIYHEYTHVLVQLIGKGQAPSWINEGLAQHIEGLTEKDIPENLAAKYNKSRLSLEKLEGSFLDMKGGDVDLVYGVSLSVTKYLIEVYGAFAVTNIIKEVSTGITAEEALINVVGLNYATLESRWLRYIR